MKRKMKKNIIHSLAVLLMTAAAVSCSKEVTPEPDGAIRLDPKVGEGYNDTKASIFSDAELPETETFHVDAFLSDPSGAVKPYFSSYAAHLYIYNDQDQIDEWRFCDLPSGSPAWKNYYFPLEGTVDFFAYVPQNYVTVSKTTNPPTFSAELPHLSAQTDKVKEFMYAYTPAMSKESPTVPLAFEHPFAAIRFVVGQSHRNLTIISMGFKNIVSSGTCTLNEDNGRYLPSWTPETPETQMLVDINKIIPGDINFGGPVGETYIVMPQNLDAVKFVINYSWNNNDDNNSNDEYNIEVALGGSWTAGKIYTYSLDLGNSAEEILFNVNVEQWVHTYDYTFELK